jgi:hypothetical protein
MRGGGEVEKPSWCFGAFPIGKTPLLLVVADCLAGSTCAAQLFLRIAKGI